VNAIIRNRIATRKRRLQQRLDKDNYPDDLSRPMIRGSTPQYELAGRASGTAYGGIGLIHQVVRDLGLAEAIDQRLHLFKVHLPLLRPALGAAALLVFVVSMKELPATLLLRPFNFDTLATQVFTLVSLYRYEEAGLSALTIVLVSLAPVLLLHGIVAGSRPGGSIAAVPERD